MRKRIEELARGKFEYGGPILQFSVDRIEIEVLEGKDSTGEFLITSSNHVSMEGLIYSSNPRMECLTPKFEGEEARIRYEFHSDGMCEGDIQKGDFFIVCNEGEYNLSFVVSILNLYANSTIGSIQNLSDFTKLAMENQEEARHIFYSPFFKNIMKVRDKKDILLYEGMSGGTSSNQSMEEFLVTTGKKEKVEITITKDNYAFYGVQEMFQVLLPLQKKQWGYAAFRVTSDADFLIPSKERITTEDFVGSVCEYACYLDPKEMHAGKNYGSILFENIYQRLSIHFCASREAEEEKSQEHHEKKALQIKLSKLYQDYRIKKIVTGRWAVQSCEIFDILIAKNPQNHWYPLMKAQAFLANSQRQEAEWILDAFKRECKDKNSSQWGYYLYLTTLIEREESYVNRIEAQIEQLYMEHKNSTILFWCLLFLREEYESNRHRKLKAIEQMISRGKESPLLYIEAYSLIQQEPFLLNTIGGFELRILNWARKQKALTQEVAEQIMRLIPDMQGYQRLILLLLEACYELLHTEQAVGAVCSYLIKNQRYGRRYFAWYEKGVEEKLRITGLYEAYLMSLDIRSVVEVPKIILMYFKYNNNLADRQKAMLYVNIIANKKRQTEIYEQYIKSMYSFALEQLKAHRMDDNLAVIYEEVLQNGDYKEETAEYLADVLFVHKITCFEKKAAFVIVLHKQLKRPQIVPVTGGIAYVNLYTNDYCIFIEDTMGNRYSGSISYQLEKLMYPSRYLKQCLKFAPHRLPYLLYYFDSRKNYGILEEEDMLFFGNLMKAEEISSSYRTFFCVKMLGVMQSAKQEILLGNYLDDIDISLLSRADQAAVMELLADYKMYDKAYEMMIEYGVTKLSPVGQMNVLSHQIEKSNFEEDDILLSFCEMVFLRGKYNKILLLYLSMYYQGPTKYMAAIWKCAGGFQIDTCELEERIIVQMLYTTEFLDNVSEIFLSYEDAGDKLVLDAYLGYFSFHYFVNETIPPEHLFDSLKKRILSNESDVRIWKLALLKYFCEVRVLDNEEDLLERILSECMKEGMFFAFYKKLNDKLSTKHHLYDKVYLEYRSKPENRVLVHYKIGSDQKDFVTEEMTDVYHGIFVKELITFFGEVVQYYITEEIEGKTEITESNSIENSQMLGENTKSRYGVINEMIVARTLEDEYGLRKQIKEYLYLDKEVLNCFTIL